MASLEGGREVLGDVIEDLACAVCGDAVRLDGDAVRCGAGHSFDVARRGYVGMLTGRGATTGDDAAMVAARERFLARGHLAPLADAVVATAIAAAGEGLVVDAGAGTGYYLARVLDALAGRHGVALDASAHALRRAARCHERAVAIACDVWARLPVRSGAAGVLLDVFAPRNAAEMRRVLGADGSVVVAAPTGRHLHELVETLGLVRVDHDKDRRVEETLGPFFRKVASVLVEHDISLTRDDAADLVAMGPSAHHVVPDLTGLDEPIAATVSVEVSTYVPRP